jgi:hypothetical protein
VQENALVRVSTAAQRLMVDSWSADVVSDHDAASWVEIIKLLPITTHWLPTLQLNETLPYSVIVT